MTNTYNNDCSDAITHCNRSDNKIKQRSNTVSNYDINRIIIIIIIIKTKIIVDLVEVKCQKL